MEQGQAARQVSTGLEPLTQGLSWCLGAAGDSRAAVLEEGGGHR